MPKLHLHTVRDTLAIIPGADRELLDLLERGPVFNVAHVDVDAVAWAGTPLPLVPIVLARRGSTAVLQPYGGECRVRYFQSAGGLLYEFGFQVESVTDRCRGGLDEMGLVYDRRRRRVGHFGLRSSHVQLAESILGTVLGSLAVVVDPRTRFVERELIRPSGLRTTPAAGA